MSTVNATIYAALKSTVTVLCALNVARPSWSGPPMNSNGMLTLFKYEESDTVNPIKTRVSLAANKRDIVITEFQGDDTGIYMCASIRTSNVA